MRGARTAAATAVLAGLTNFRESIMSERECITVRRMSLREAVDPSNRARVLAFFQRQGGLVAWSGYLRSIGEAIR